jgi:hypothetical protein
MTFGTEKNLHTAYKQFEISDFEMAYNAFLRRLTMTKFMVTHHYAYLVLKMLGPNRVITIRQDVKRAYNYERESCKIAEALLASVELQDPKKVMAKDPPPPPASVMPKSKTLKMSIQSKDKLNKTIPLFPSHPTKVAHMGNNLDPK